MKYVCFKWFNYVKNILNLINLHIKVLILGKIIYLRNLAMVDFLTELVHFFQKEESENFMYVYMFFSIF